MINAALDGSGRFDRLITPFDSDSSSFPPSDIDCPVFRPPDGDCPSLSPAKTVVGAARSTHDRRATKPIPANSATKGANSAANRSWIAVQTSRNQLSVATTPQPRRSDRKAVHVAHPMTGSARTNAPPRYIIGPRITLKSAENSEAVSVIPDEPNR